MPGTAGGEDVENLFHGGIIEQARAGGN
jgi:hypothetical protein